MARSPYRLTRIHPRTVGQAWIERQRMTDARDAVELRVRKNPETVFGKALPFGFSSSMADTGQPNGFLWRGIDHGWIFRGSEGEFYIAAGGGVEGDLVLVDPLPVLDEFGNVNVPTFSEGAVFLDWLLDKLDAEIEWNGITSTFRGLPR